ncbi:hypothetical protein [Hymenobacter yonginensis]|uniref:Uncharacterized protein n=1 Tax=Hymenobacter yonginensis TaxID=748197 RepID=A0ABY7PTM3_9BACT|nr:hypothetical protein [Hymenobacter yonginensis]WBO86266.1 hypothetical protein O9Z63_08385 [Hymenobacter yonginensis]
MVAHVPATAPVSSASVSPASWPATALTRAWVVWENGFKKTFHSYDTSGRYEVADPRRYGIRGFRSRVLDKAWPSPIKEMILYDHQTGARLEVWVSKGVRLV